MGYPQLALNDDEKWKLEVILPFHDTKTRLFLSDIVHIWVFIVEGDLQRGAVIAREKVLVFHLFCEEKVLILTDFHTKAKFVGQATENLCSRGNLKRVDVVEEKFYPALETLDNESID